MPVDYEIGEGMISILYGEDRESYEIRKGDVMMIPSGSIMYQVNKHQKESLRIAMLLCPVSLPGHFEVKLPPSHPHTHTQN